MSLFLDEVSHQFADDEHAVMVIHLGWLAGPHHLRVWANIIPAPLGVGALDR